MIYFIGNSTTTSLEIYSITKSTFEEFVKWESQQLAYQLDVESNVCNSIVERKLKLIQFGDLKGINQFVIDPTMLSTSQANKLLQILDNPAKEKLIHNAVFEYTLLKKYGVQITNIYDTLLAEKIIWCGYPALKAKKGVPGFYSLKELTLRYLFKERNKELQTSFDCKIFTPEQIHYAADDVIDLHHIKLLQLYCSPYYNTQIKCITEARLENVLALENAVVEGFSEIQYNGMRLDLDKWRANVALADPIIEDAKERLDGFIRDEPFKSKCIELGFLTDKESLTINWNSTLQKKLVFSVMFPNLSGFTQPVIKKYLKQEDILNTSDVLLLEAYLKKDYVLLEIELQMNHRKWLLENNLIVESNKVLISWTSPVQKLKLFQIINSKIKSTGEPVLSEYEHPLIDAYFEWLKSNTLKTKYGEKFIEKHLESDGKVRPHFDQIKSTGRVSSFNYNQQNIPSGEKVGTRYRNCFISDKGWQVCSADFASQELTLIAYFSNENIWLSSLANNEDLHSTTAEVVFKDEWKNGAESNCLYYKLKEDGTRLHEKCKCKKHKTLRVLIKTINYMLCYGGSEYKLSSVAKISLDEARQTIKEYFEAFPKLKRILDGFSNYGIKKGYIITATPFNRRRYFHYWKGEETDKWLQAKIGRASSNTPLQGSSSDEMKLAMCLIQWYIRDNNLWNKVKIVANIHDEAVCHVVDDYAKEWKPVMKSLMEEAASITLPVGMLKADTELSGTMWSK